MQMSVIKAPEDFCLELKFLASAKQLFTALTTLDGIQGWWTVYAEVSEKKVSANFPSQGFHVVSKIVAKTSPHLLEWLCEDSCHAVATGYSDLKEWIGTRIRFDIKELGVGQSQLTFTHFRLNALECVDACSSGWQFFLNESLRGYLEQGKGSPWKENLNG